MQEAPLVRKGTRKNKAIRRIIALLTLMLFGSCSKSKPNQSKQVAFSPAQYQQVFGLDVFSNSFGFLNATQGAGIGTGYNSEIGGFPGSQCLYSGSAENYLNSPPGTNPSLSNGFVRNEVREIDTRSLVTRTFDLRGSGSGGIGLFTASVDVRSAGSFASSENRKLFIAEYVETSAPRLLNLSDVEKLLTPAALDALKADNSGAQFKQKCGDYVVIGYYLGAGGSLLMSYDSISDEEASQFAASLEASYGAFGKVSGSAAETMQSLSQNRNLQVSFVGWGGITQSDIEKGIPNIESVVAPKLASLQNQSAASPTQGLVVRVLLAPWSSLLPARFRPPLQANSSGVDALIDLASRESQLEALARAYDETRADTNDIRNIAWGMTPADRQTLAEATRRTIQAMNEVGESIKLCIGGSSRECHKYDNAIVRPAPTGSTWKLNEGGQTLIDYVCTHSAPNVGPSVTLPTLDTSKPVTVGLFGTYTINGIPEDFSQIFNNSNMKSCCSKYTMMFAAGGEFLPHGQAVTVEKINTVMLQVEKWADATYQGNRADCTKYKDDEQNPLRILFAQKFSIDTTPFVTAPAQSSPS